MICHRHHTEENFEDVMDYRTSSCGNAKPNSKPDGVFLLKQGGNKVLKSTYLPGKSILHSFLLVLSTRHLSQLGFELGLALAQL